MFVYQMHIKCYIIISCNQIITTYMIRSLIPKYLCSQLYRPLRPLVADRTLIYQVDPLRKPNRFLHQVPALLVAANNFLTSWTLLSTGGFIFIFLASNLVYIWRMVHWYTTVTHISTNRTFDKLYFQFCNHESYLTKIPQNESYKFNKQTDEFQIDRSLIEQDMFSQKPKPKEISEVNMDQAVRLSILKKMENGTTSYVGFMLLKPFKNKVKGYQEYIRALIARKEIDPNPF